MTAPTFTVTVPTITVPPDWDRHKVLLVGDLEEIRAIVREEIVKALLEVKPVSAKEAGTL